MLEARGNRYVESTHIKIGKIGNISHRGDFFMFIPHRRLNNFFYHTLNSSVLISHFVIGC
jgi:hypothetical protein